MEVFDFWVWLKYQNVTHEEPKETEQQPAITFLLGTQILAIDIDLTPCSPPI